MSNFWVENTSICSSFSVQFSHSVMSNSLWPHGLQQARPPCPSPTPRVNSNSCPLSQYCHPTSSSSVVPFSSCLQSFLISGSFQMSGYMVIKSSEIIKLENSLSACLKNLLSNFIIYLPCSLKNCYLSYFKLSLPAIHQVAERPKCARGKVLNGNKT